MKKKALSYIGFVVLIIGVVILNVTRPPWQILGLVITSFAILFPAFEPIFDFFNRRYINYRQSLISRERRNLNNAVTRVIINQYITPSSLCRESFKKKARIEDKEFNNIEFYEINKNLSAIDQKTDKVPAWLEQKRLEMQNKNEKDQQYVFEKKGKELIQDFS